MTLRIDVCNGDADGLCAALQWHLHDPAPARLVTGLKRDIALLERVDAQPGDEINVFDLGMARNMPALHRLLARGVRVRYVDHHECGDVPDSPLLEAHIALRSDTCSSLLVDGLLGGAFRAWALVGAYGDNLTQVADALAEQTGLSLAQRQALRRLGEAINYNAYGERLDEVCMAPAGLFALMKRHTDPWDFLVQEPVAEQLIAYRARDLQQAHGLPPHWLDARAAVYLLPDEAWAHRVSGTFANELAQGEPQRAHAVLKSQGTGYLVSVRAPLQRPWGADGLCKCFGGGGRHGAAGIDCLAPDGLDEFVQAFMRHAWAPPPAA
jgi:hypothetical protein